MALDAAANVDFLLCFPPAVLDQNIHFFFATYSLLKRASPLDHVVHELELCRAIGNKHTIFLRVYTAAVDAEFYLSLLSLGPVFIFSLPRTSQGHPATHPHTEMNIHLRHMPLSFRKGHLPKWLRRSYIVPQISLRRSYAIRNSANKQPPPPPS